MNGGSENRGQSPVFHSAEYRALTPVYQGGFTYIALLIFVAATGAVTAAAGSLWSFQAQREKEVELLFVGEQFRQAIASYYHKSPGEKRYPAKLEDLLQDRRNPSLQRHLRRIYADPITGKADWGLVQDPRGGVMGVHSLSEAEPIRAIDNKKRYCDWLFAVEPAG